MLKFSDLLTHHRDRILQRWEGMARKTTPGRSPTRTGLHEGVRRLLDDLALTLGQTVGGGEGPLERDGYTLDEVVEEYALLRDAVWSEWMERSPEGIHSTEAQLFHLALDGAMRATAAMYARAHVTELGRERAALGDARKTIEMLQAAVERATMGIVVLDADGRHILVNAAWCEQTGKRPEEVIGRTTMELWQNPESERAVALQIEAIRQGRGLSDQEYSHLQGGSMRHYRWSLVPLHTLEALPKCGIAFTSDITAEMETRSLRDLFLHLLAHDLRNPLFAMQLNLQLLSESRDDLEAMQQLEARLQGTIARMVRMVHELLDMAKAEHPGGIKVDLRDVDVARVVGDAIRLLFPDSNQAQVTLALGPGCRARVDADRLVQALENLIRNALTHGRQGAKVEVSVREAGAMVEVSVHNEGPPIPAEDLPHIFEPYRQARHRAAGGSSEEGLGLGLYIVRAIAVAHGGDVTVRSTAAEGTTFMMRLPRSSEGG